jgi:hypothetical protein
MVRRVVNAAAPLAVSAFLIGCGGSSDGEATTSSPVHHEITMAEYISRADAICAGENAKLIPKAEHAEAQNNLHVFASELHQYVREFEDGLTHRLRAIEVPAAKSSQIETMWRIQDAQATLLDTLAGAASESNLSEMESLGTQIELNREKYRGLARGLGFRRCGDHREKWQH